MQHLFNKICCCLASSVNDGQFEVHSLRFMAAAEKIERDSFKKCTASASVLVPVILLSINKFVCISSDVFVLYPSKCFCSTAAKIEDEAPDSKYRL